MNRRPRVPGPLQRLAGVVIAAVGGDTQRLSVPAFIVANAAVGALLGMAMAGAMLLTDTFGLATLIRDSSDPVTPVAMLLAGFAITIGQAFVGTAIMSLRAEE